MLTRPLAGAALLVATLAPAVQAQPIDNPTAAYRSATTLLPITGAPGTSTTSVSSGGNTVSFQNAAGAPTALDILTVATSNDETRPFVSTEWATWNTISGATAGYPYFSEWTRTSPLPVLATSAGTLRLQANQLYNYFGVEFEPDPFEGTTVVASFFNGATLVGTTGATFVRGLRGARLLGYQVLGTGFDRIELTTGFDFAISNVRVGRGTVDVSNVVPEPSTVVLVGLGLAGAGLAARRRRAAAA